MESIKRRRTDQTVQEGGLEKEKEAENKEEKEASNSVIPLQDLYLDTIDRKRLDFDFEKLCSVSLSNVNVYACLVCGKYYQGRGRTSFAYFHSIDEDHHVFIHLQTLKVYVLPDGYEVKDQSLEDIKYVIYPVYTKTQVAKIDHENLTVYDLNNKKYTPGFVGLNNIKANDYVNVVLQALVHVPPLRDAFLLQDLSGKSELVQRFGTLIRKIWNFRAFKGQVSPHELVQEIANVSKKRFQLSVQSDPVHFLAWFLNQLHTDLADKTTGKSILTKIFQGSVRIQSQSVPPVLEGMTRENRHMDVERETLEKALPFMFLTLELPPVPLFKDAVKGSSIIPQVPLSILLEKFDGFTVQETRDELRRLRLLKLPKYLILHYKRFYRNNFSEEKNPTIINYPVKQVSFSDYVENDDDARYDLLANICHDGQVKGGSYSLHIRTRDGKQWYKIQDLIVERILPELIILSESYIQIWERNE